MSGLAITLGHLLLGGLFVFAGLDHFARFGAVKGMLAQRGWPAPGMALAVASMFEIAAGFGLALDVLRPWAALGLAAFVVAANLMLLDFWRCEGQQRETTRSSFILNVGLLGGLILAFGESL